MSSSIQEFIPRFFWICSSFKVLVFCAMFHLDRVSALILFFIWRDFKILYFVWNFYISFSKVFPFTPASPVLLEICGQVSFAVFNVFMFSYLLFIISVVLNLLCCCLVILILFTCALCPQLCLVFLITSHVYLNPQCFSCLFPCLFPCVFTFCHLWGCYAVGHMLRVFSP